MIITLGVDDAVHFQAQVTLCDNCANGIMAEVLKERTRVSRAHNLHLCLPALGPSGKAGIVCVVSGFGGCNWIGKMFTMLSAVSGTNWE